MARAKIGWSERELKLLKEIYPVATRGELEKKLSRHTIGSIYVKAFELGLKRKNANRGS